MSKTMVAAALCIVAAAFAGCGGSGGSGSDGKGDSKGTPASGAAPESVKLVLRGDVDSFDPHKSSADSGAKQMFDAIYDTLVRQSPKGARGGMQPALAKSWDVTPTGATLQLKDGLTCSDGSKLTASGIAKSLKRIANPATGALYASRIFGPEGAKSIKADNAKNTITIELEGPYTYLVEGLSFAYIICPDGLDDEKKLAGEPAGTGPYQVTSQRRGDSYELTRRESTAVDDINALPKTIDMRVVNDDTTRANLIDSGEVDIASILGRDAKRLEAQHKPIAGPAFLADALLFNQAEGHPGADPAFRRAVAQAVDNAAYTRAATFDLGKPIDTIYTPNMECYTEANGSLTPKFDLEKAKADLKAAGYGPGGKNPTIRLLGYDPQNSGPEYLADALRKLGLTVKLSDGTLEQALGVLFGTGEWDAFVWPYPVTTYMPSSLVNQISGKVGASLNVGGVQNETYDQLVREASAVEGDERCQKWGEAEAALLKAVDVKPLVWSNAEWFTNGMTFDANYFYVDTRTIRKAG